MYEKNNRELRGESVITLAQACCSGNLCNNEELCTPQSPHRHFPTAAPKITMTTASTATRCSYNPCFNGGVCIKQGPNFRCVCGDGYTGLVCQEGMYFANIVISQ